MDQAYNDTLKRLREQHQNSSDLAFRVLAWICYTGWKLPADAIQHGLALREGDTTFHEDGVVDKSLLLSVCCGLVEIPKGSKEIRLVHYTTERFFRHNRHLIDEYFLVRHSLDFHLPSNSDAYLARQCVTCLSIGLPRHRPGGIGSDPGHRTRSHDTVNPSVFSQLDKHQSPEDREKSIGIHELESNPLYEYSTFNWGGHVRRLSPLDQTYKASIDFLLTRGIVNQSIMLILTLGRRTIRTVAWMDPWNRDCRHLFWGCFSIQDHGTWSGDRQALQYVSNLHLAALFGLGDLAESLMKNIDINSRDNCGRTALVWALECLAFKFKFKPVYKISATKNFEIYDGIDVTRRRIVNALLKSGANSRMSGCKWDTPLHLAAILGDVEIVERILEHGVDIDTLNRNVDVPLEQAVRHSMESASMKLLESGTVDTCGENSRTALTETSSVRDLALMETLIEKGAKVDFPDINGQTALMKASRFGHAQIVKFLLENQSNVDHQNHKGGTTLMEACIGDHADVIELLLGANAQLGFVNAVGNTALSNAAKCCGKYSIKQLLRHSTDPAIRDQHSGTVLVSAIKWNKPDIVSLILEDAEFKPTSKQIDLAFSVSCYKGDEKIARLLIDHGANPNMNPNARRSPESLLMHAIYRGDDAVVLLLLDAGISSENEDDTRVGPIHAAALAGTKVMVQSLIDKGISVNHRASAGRLPLDYAMRRQDKDTSIADLLRKHGAITEGKRLVQLMQDRSKTLNQVS